MPEIRILTRVRAKGSTRNEGLSSCHVLFATDNRVHKHANSNPIQFMF